MKRQSIRVIILALILVPVAFFEIHKQLGGFSEFSESFFIFDDIAALLSKLLLIGIGVISLVRIIKASEKIYMVPLALSLGTLIATFIIQFYWNMRESSPIIMEARFRGELHEITVTLRKNKTYKLEDYGMYNGRTYFGEYEFNHDTLRLSNFQYLGEENNVKSNLLVKKNDFLIPLTHSNGVYTEDTLASLKLKKAYL